jgi:hypothetical protein
MLINEQRRNTVFDDIASCKDDLEKGRGKVVLQWSS